MFLSMFVMYLDENMNERIKVPSPLPLSLIFWRSARVEWLEWRKSRLYRAVSSPSRAPGSEELAKKCSILHATQTNKL